MADKERTKATGRATSVPPPQDSYIPPDEEVWSDATQDSADRYLRTDADQPNRRGGA